jgi:hypothetical protein
MSENNFYFICPWEYSIELFLSDRYYIFFFTERLLLSGQIYGGSDKGLEETHFEYMYDLLYNLVESGFILFYFLFLEISIDAVIQSTTIVFF